MLAPRTDLVFLNSPAATRWENLGDWTEAKDYASAASALARRVARAAGLADATRALDCGCGAGEQLLLWAREFAPTRIVAVEADAGRARSAAARVRRAGLGERARVLRGSATALERTLARAGEAEPFDAVLAVDCAYFFRPRAAFLRQAARRAAPGARLALSDLVLGPRAPRALEDLARWAGLPPRNLLSEAAYVTELERAGWRLEGWETLDREVLAGFGRFALGGAVARRAARRPLAGWPKIVGTGLACRMAVARGLVRYVLVRGRRA